MSKEPKDISIMACHTGLIVKSTRIKMHMSQPGFANMMHVPLNVLMLWESGDANPPEYFMDMLGVRYKEHIDSNMMTGLSLQHISNKIDIINKKVSDIAKVLITDSDKCTKNQVMTDLEAVVSDDSADDITDDDIFCLTEEEENNGIVANDNDFIDISVYLAAKNMSDDELNSSFSPEVIKQLGRRVLDFDTIDLSNKSLDI